MITGSINTIIRMILTIPTMTITNIIITSTTNTMTTSIGSVFCG